MKALKRASKLSDIGVPLGDVVRDNMRDPEYRRNYLRIKVRVRIAGVIKSLRLSRGLTQKQLAARAGVPQPQIARLEGLADERIPSLDFIIRLLSALESDASLVLRPSPGSRRGANEIVLA